MNTSREPAPGDGVAVSACHATMSQVNRRTGQRELQCFVQVTVGDWYKELDFGNNYNASVAFHRAINAGAVTLSEPAKDEIYD